ncbi:hypothetical protein BH11BAC5_BH11BAC5_29160 [soil metagenome]
MASVQDITGRQHDFRHIGNDVFLHFCQKYDTSVWILNGYHMAYIFCVTQSHQRIPFILFTLREQPLQINCCHVKIKLSLSLIV